ncbi:S1 family serine peptidase [Photobacterium sp. R1]
MKRTIFQWAAAGIVGGLITASCSVFAEQNSAQEENAPVARVIGGTTTYAGELPWQALIYIDYGRDGNEVYQCGGVIIDMDTVLTAAHCMKHNNVAAQSNEVLVWGGITSTSSATIGNAHTVASVTIHPGYDASTFVNDIALLRLNTGFSSSVQPIQLATVSEQNQADLAFENSYVHGGESPENLLVSGWGRTSADPDAAVSQDLQHTLLTGVPDDYCNSVWSNINSTNLDSFVCAISPLPNVDRDSCQGDSGGPLVWQNPQASADADFGLRLVGLVSFGAQCASDVPAVYTEVSHFRTWIWTITGTGFDFDPDPVFTSDPFSAENSARLNRETSTHQTVGYAGSGGSGGSMAPGILIVLFGLFFWRSREKSIR